MARNVLNISSTSPQHTSRPKPIRQEYVEQQPEAQAAARVPQLAGDVMQLAYTVTGLAYPSASGFKSATFFDRYASPVPRHTFQPLFTGITPISWGHVANSSRLIQWSRLPIPPDLLHCQSWRADAINISRKQEVMVERMTAVPTTMIGS